MTFMRAQVNTGLTTPTVEKSAGVRPAQHFKPAHYLPLVRLDSKTGAYKVVSTGKVLAVDNNGLLVPAGLALDIETALAATWDVDGTATSLLAQAKALEVATPGTFGLVYSATDVSNGVKNWAGDAASAGEPVVASMLKSGAVNYKTANPATAVTVATGAYVGKPIGIAPYDIWQNNSLTANIANNPNSFTYTNFNMQQGASVLTRYFIEVPVVADTSGLVLAGMTVFEGTPYNGSIVSFNKNSNFVVHTDLALSNADSYTTADPTDAELKAEFDRIINHINKTNGRILGKVIYVDTTFPKDYLDYVKTWTPSISGASALDKAPGTSTAGLPDNLSLAGITSAGSAKVARINLWI